MLNAVVDERYSEALEDAKKCDQLVNNPDFEKSEAANYPLFGVPVTIKGSIAVKGLKHASGSITRKDHVAQRDAKVVTLLRKAGKRLRICICSC